jgi:dihydroorotate dehydrogenase (NAD+) catalytic subunit
VTLTQTLFGACFQNPVMLASGTCGYGEEFDRIIDLDRLGGLVIKSVTMAPRAGNAAPRVAEFHGGMLNSIGLANVGVEEVRRTKLPWLASRLKKAQVWVNVAGMTAEEYGSIISRLDDCDGFLGYELNVSCPNVKEGGAHFSSRPDLLATAVAAARHATQRPIIVKLAPNVPDIGAMAGVAVAEGADGLSLVNTLPGLLYDLDTRAPVLGAGPGGVSGPALLPVGVHAVRQARKAVGSDVPLVGVGGIRTGADALQYVLAGASLVQVGTASFADPRAGLRVLTDLESAAGWAGAVELNELIGTGADLL